MCIFSPAFYGLTKDGHECLFIVGSLGTITTLIGHIYIYIISDRSGSDNSTIISSNSQQSAVIAI